MASCWPSLSCLALVAGCKVVDAPQTVQDLVDYGFVHFQDDDRYVTATVTGLYPLLDAHDAELREGLRITELSQEDLDDAGVDVTIDGGILGAAVRVDHASTVDDLAAVWTWDQLDQVLSQTLSFDVTSEEGDRDCFLAHECDRYANEGTRTNSVGILGQSTQTFRREYRWGQVDDDGPRVFTLRELVPDETEMTTDLVRIHQMFKYSVYFEDDPGTIRLESVWAAVEVVGVDVPDYFALDMTVSDIQHSVDEIDAWVADNGAPSR